MMSIKFNGSSRQPESQVIELEALKELYAEYLKEVSPDWSEERIYTEVNEVFAEQNLEHSLSQRRKFHKRLTQKLDKIKRHPTDWFFHEDNHHL